MDLLARRLLELVHSKGGAVAVGQGNATTIAKVLDVAPGDLIDIARRLEIDGLVTLERTTSESFFVELTHRGESALEHAPPQPQAQPSAAGTTRRLWLLLLLVALVFLLTGIVIGYMLGASDLAAFPGPVLNTTTAL